MTLKCATLALVAEASGTVMGFKIKVLVNCEPLERGDLVTEPHGDKVKNAPKSFAAITIGQVLEKIKTS